MHSVEQMERREPEETGKCGIFKLKYEEIKDQEIEGTQSQQVHTSIACIDGSAKIVSTYILRYTSGCKAV